jgi:immune inhibitor A
MKTRLLAWFLSLGFVFATAGAAHAVQAPADAQRPVLTAPDLMPLNPEIVESYRAAGREVPLSSAEARFADRPNVRINRIARPTALTTNATGAASADSVRAIVLLVQFTDNPPGGPTTRYNSTVWDNMLFGDNYIRGGADTTTTRTLKSFFNSVSYGAIDVVTLNLPSAVGWLTAPNNYAYYCQADGVHDNGFGPYPRNVQRLVMDAVIAADPYVDFSQYAVGGVVQNLFVVHAGSGAEWNGGSSLIWSHAWSIRGGGAPLLYVDGVLIDSYSMEPEAGGNTTGEGGSVTGPQLPTVGVYAHEFGHVLGLPDEYDYGYQSRGTGSISLMAGGSWNRTPNIYPYCAGNSPARPSAWAMAYLGFVTPTVVTTLTIGVSIPPIETTGPGSIYKLVQPGSGGNEYWLFENRQQLGFDAGFASMGTTAHGLCIYHVDENVMSRAFWRPNEAECVSGGVYRGQNNCDCAALPVNLANGEKWYGISVEQADGLYQLELNGGNGASDFYPNPTGKTSFTPSTAPNSSSYYSANACAGLVTATNIQEVGGNIILDLSDVPTYSDIAVTPDSLTAELPIGQQATRTLTIANTGDGYLSYEISVSKTGAMAALAAPPRVSQRFTPAVDWAESQAAAADRLASAPALSAIARPLRAPLASAPSRLELSSTADADLRILIVNVGGDDSEIHDLLTAMPGVAVVDEFNGAASVPTLGLLRQYNTAILTVTAALPDPVGLGDVLADYADQGGGIVLTVASFTGGYEIKGRLLAGGYIPFTAYSGFGGGGTLGASDSTHPIMSGVEAVSSSMAALSPLAPGARWVASYADGLPLVATRGSHVVGVNLFVGSSGYWTGNVPELMYNATAWASGPQWVWAAPRLGVVPPGDSVEVTATFDATGLPGGDYRADLTINSNDPNDSTVLIPAYLHVPDPPLAVDELAPVVSFALHGLKTNPTTRDIIVAFSLPDAGSATLELIDISGRRVVAQEVGSLGPGRHAVALGGGMSHAPGVYLARLSRAGKSFTVRAVVLR